MSLITFTSAKGSPGVTRIVGELAHVWAGDPVVADLDPASGDVVLLERGADGGPLSAETGLVSLGAALRGGKAADLDDHLQLTEEGIRVLVGVSTPTQVHAIGPVWSNVATTLSRWSGDVLADVGRFELGSPVQPVIESASTVVFVVRDDVPSLAHLRERLQVLREPLSIGRLGGTPVGVVLVGDPSASRAESDVVRLLAASGLEVAGLGTVADDPKALAQWARLSDRARRRSLFHRSLVDVGHRLRELVESTSDLPTAAQQGA